MRRTIFPLAFLALATGLLSAQWRERVQYPETDPNAFRITTQADLEDALARIARLTASMQDARDAAEREFYITSILELCQRELNREANTSGVVVVERASPRALTPELPLRWEGAYSAIEGQLRALGPGGIAIYERLYGQRARALFEQHLAMRDRRQLALLNRRYGLTQSGAQGAVALAAIYWEEGSLSQAARMLERALENEFVITGQARADLSAWLSRCYRMRGERANLQQLITQSRDLRELKVSAGPRSVALGELLAEDLAATRDSRDELADRVGVFAPGGNYANTGRSEAPAGYDSITWMQMLPPQGATPNRLPKGYHAPLVTPHLPVFDGSMLYVNTGDQLVAYDLINGSRGPVWSRRPFPVFAHNWRTQEPDPDTILPLSIHRGTVYVALENPLSDSYHSRQRDPQFGLYSHYPKARRAMCAIDGATGRLLWKAGGEYEGTALATMNFMSGIVYEEVLYAIGTRSQAQAEVFLYALEPSTGEEIWNLRLCYGQQETTMFGRPAREPHPSLPAFAGSLAYVNTNIGGVVAVDLNMRSIRWISRYDYMPRPVSKYIDTFYREPSWYNSPTLYTEHRGRAYVVAAPTDAGKLFAMDALTGEVLWELNRRGEPLHGGRALIGVHGGSLIIAGDGDGAPQQSMLHAVDIASGRVTRSSTALPNERASPMMLLGRPAMAGSSVLWPGFDPRSGAAIAEVDLDTFRMRGTASVPATYANAGFSVFSQYGVVYTVAGRDYTRGNTQIAMRFDSQYLLTKARNDVRDNPQSAEANLRFGLLTLRLGNRAEGLSAIRNAHALATQPPVDARVRDQAAHALVDEYLVQAQSAVERRAFDDALRHVDSARGFASNRAQFSECFRVQEAAITGRGDSGATLAFYRGIIDANPDFGVGSDPELPVRIYATVRLAKLLGGSEPQEAVRLYHTILTANERLRYEGMPLRAVAMEQLIALLRRHGRAPFQRIEDAAAAQLEEGTPDALRRVLTDYPLSLAAEQAVLRLAEVELTESRPREGAELIHALLDEFAERERQLELRAVMAVCYARAGHALRARMLARALLRGNPTGSLTLLGRSYTYSELLLPLIGESEHAHETAVLPRLPAAMRELWRQPWAEGYTRIAALHANTGGRVYLSRGVEVLGVEAATGNTIWQRRDRLMISETRHVPDGILFTYNQGLALYDEAGNERWTYMTGFTPEQVSLRAGMVVFAARFVHETTRQSMIRIGALDVANGSRVWESTHDGHTVRWLEQSIDGVYALIQGTDTRVVLLDGESGEIIRETALETPDRRIGINPILDGERVLIIDRMGTVHILDFETLRLLGTLDSRVRGATFAALTQHGIVVAGMNAATLFHLTEQREVWNVRLTGETVRAHRLLHDQLVLVTLAGADSRVHGYRLKDGTLAFNRQIASGDDDTRMWLQSEAEFDGGLAMIFVEQRRLDNRWDLGGFRLLVLNHDGTERFSWRHESQSSASVVQLAITEGYLIAGLDNTTFAFGGR